MVGVTSLLLLRPTCRVQSKDVGVDVFLRGGCLLERKGVGAVVFLREFPGGENCLARLLNQTTSTSQETMKNIRHDSVLGRTNSGRKKARRDSAQSHASTFSGSYLPPPRPPSPTGKKQLVPSLLGPVVPSFRALSGRKFMVRRHKFNKDSLSLAPRDDVLEGLDRVG